MDHPTHDLGRYDGNRSDPPAGGGQKILPLFLWVFFLPPLRGGVNGYL